LAFLPRVLPWSAVQILLSILCIVAAITETIRLSSPAAHRVIARLVPVYRDSEARRVSGAFWLAAGYAVTVWIPWVGPPAATAGVAVAALADPAASLVGSSFSRMPGKSWIGSAAAMAIAALVLAALALPLKTIAIAAVVAAAAERVPAPLDDNILIAPSVAWVVAALA
jgi:dolichol kinase